MSLKKPIWIYLENGDTYEANSFGWEGTKTGELVFNTSMTGYQEIATDPSYAGQFVLFTAPEIGNVGVNDDDMESTSVHASGFLVRHYQERYSNYRGEKSFATLLEEEQSLGICDIDTRHLTKMLRDKGALMMIASTQISDFSVLKEKLHEAPRIEEIDYIEQVSTKEVYTHQYAAWDESAQVYRAPSTDKKIVAIDFGVKRNILNELTQSGLEVEVIPHDFDAATLIKRYEEKEINGVFLSNGPGDPLILKNIHKEIKKMIEAKVPMFGICLGHQLLSISHGYDTYKLKFGHHGGNHPVKGTLTSAVEITAQNHNYNVPEEISDVAQVTHSNLFDGTIEGLKYNDANIFSVQHHPEASPGPHESKYIFTEFAKNI